MPRTLSQIERDKTDLLAEKLELDHQISELKTELADARQRVGLRREYSNPKWWKRANADLAEKGRRSQEIQFELSKLRMELNRLRHGETRPLAPVTPQAQTAVLWRVAHAARRYLFEENDDSAEEAGDVLERELDELDYVNPRWFERKPSAYRKAS